MWAGRDAMAMQSSSDSSCTATLDGHKARAGSMKPARTSPTGTALCKAASAGFCRLSSTGAWKSNECPTPGLYLSVRHLDCQGRPESEWRS